MAAYPLWTDIPQVHGSEQTVSSGIQLDRAISGKPRFRRFFSQDWSVFKVIHDVDLTDHNTLMSHYSGDKDNNFSFTWSGTNTAFTVRYAGAPKRQPTEGTDRWRIENILVQVS